MVATASTVATMVVTAAASVPLRQQHVRLIRRWKRGRGGWLLSRWDGCRNWRPLPGRDRSRDHWVLPRQNRDRNWPLSPDHNRGRTQPLSQLADDLVGGQPCLPAQDRCRN